jgi:hypothetical protein
LPVDTNVAATADGTVMEFGSVCQITGRSIMPFAVKAV